MSFLQLPLTDSMKNFLDKQAAKKGFPSPNEYVHVLLSDMQRRDEGRKELEEKLREGLRGPSIAAGEAFWRDLKEEFLCDHPELRSCDT